MPVRGLLISILTGTGTLLAWIFPYRFRQRCQVAWSYLFAQGIRRELGCCGKRFAIEPPCTLLGGKYISVGDNFDCRGRLRLEAYELHNGIRFSPKIIIGNNVGINFDCHIACINAITIGDNVLMASKVFITDHFHGEINARVVEVPPAMRPLYSKGSVTIERNVWIGEGVVILPGVTIGEGSIIGANSVVTKDLPKFSVAAGNPIRLIKTLVENEE